MRKLLLLTGILLITLVSCSKDSMDSPDVMSVEKETPMVDSTAGKSGAGAGQVIKGLTSKQYDILKEMGMTRHPNASDNSIIQAYYRNRTPQSYRDVENGLYDSSQVSFIYYADSKQYRIKKYDYTGFPEGDHEKFDDFEKAARYALNLMTVSQPQTDALWAYGFVRQENVEEGLRFLHKSGVYLTASFDDTYVEVVGSGKTERFEEKDTDTRVGAAIAIAIEFSKEPQTK